MKVYPFYIGAENLPVFCPPVMWKAEVISDELRYLSEEIFKQSIENAD